MEHAVETTTAQSNPAAISGLTSAIDPDHAIYDNPLVTRYASSQMTALFSPHERIRTWRLLWTLLAETEAELGLNITPQQVTELRQNIDNINWDIAAKREREVRHDVMAHVYTYGQAAPSASGIIHAGATSCYVTDNADLIIFRKALHILAQKTAAVIDNLATFARKYRDQPMLGLTHLQPAQPVTLGKRACLWAQDFTLDLQEIEYLIDTLPLRGCSGATGTQASFLELFGGDHNKVLQLQRKIADKLDFKHLLSVTGQTYTRKLDSRILSVVAGIGDSAGKYAVDLRLLASRREVEEPFESGQIGSSAMPYKRNPMRSERICSLARFLACLPTTAYFTQQTQWLERTLDDSAIRRLNLPQAFLAADAILELAANISANMVVYPRVIEAILRREMPFLASESILMAAVKAGGDRQELHEAIRVHSQAAALRMKEEGLDSDLLERIAADPKFAAVSNSLAAILDPKLHIGRSPQQVDAFIFDVVNPVLERYPERQASLGKAVKV